MKQSKGPAAIWHPAFFVILPTILPLSDGFLRTFRYVSTLFAIPKRSKQTEDFQWSNRKGRRLWGNTAVVKRFYLYLCGWWLCFCGKRVCKRAVYVETRSKSEHGESIDTIEEQISRFWRRNRPCTPRLRRCIMRQVMTVFGIQTHRKSGAVRSAR